MFLTGSLHPSWIMYGRYGIGDEYDRDTDSYRRTEQIREVWGMEDDLCTQTPDILKLNITSHFGTGNNKIYKII